MSLRHTLCSYAGQLVMSGLLQLQVKGWARMVGTRLFALAPALTVAIVSNVSDRRRVHALLGELGICAQAGRFAACMHKRPGGRKVPTWGRPPTRVPACSRSPLTAIAQLLVMLR